jgi:acyl-CoA thioesterase
VGAEAAGAAAPAHRAVGERTRAGVTHPFDADTALAAAGDRWRATVVERWFVETGPNGGFIAALATRALVEVAGGDDRSPRSLTLHFLAPPQAGELEVAAAVERSGRSTTFASLRILQGGETVALGLGCCAAWREGQPEWDELERPAAPRPEELPPLTRIPAAPRFLENYEMRPWPDPPGPVTAGGWMRTAEPRGADPVLLAALTDAWVPAAFLRMEEPSFVPTIDLTIHWRAPLEAVGGEHPWVLGLFSTRLGAGGTWEEDGQLWSEEGVLLAQSRQLAIVRRARR